MCSFVTCPLIVSLIVCLFTRLTHTHTSCTETCAYHRNSQASLPSADLRDPVALYNPVDAQGLSELLGLDVTPYLTALGRAELSDFNVDVPSFVTAVGQVSE